MKDRNKKTWISVKNWKIKIKNGQYLWLLFAIFGELSLDANLSSRFFHEVELVGRAFHDVGRNNSTKVNGTQLYTLISRRGASRFKQRGEIKKKKKKKNKRSSSSSGYDGLTLFPIKFIVVESAQGVIIDVSSILGSTVESRVQVLQV